MKKRLLTIGLTALLLAGGSLFARGGGQGGGYEHPSQSASKGGGVMKFLSDINLTTEQQRDIELLEVNFRYKMASSRPDRDSVLKSAITPTGFDKSTFIDGMISNATDKSESFGTHLEAVFEILTDEQKATLYNTINQ
jgi:Spy/CpxP family protein refolding chaperone